MAVEANKRSTRIPDITNSPSQPARSEALLLDDDWPQFKAETAAGRRGGGTLREPNYASQITRAKGFCPVAAANAAVDEANFGTCRSAATVRYLFRAAHELGAPPQNVSGPADLLPRHDWRLENANKNRHAGTNIESRQMRLGEEKYDKCHARCISRICPAHAAGDVERHKRHGALTTPHWWVLPCPLSIPRMYSSNSGATPASTTMLLDDVVFTGSEPVLPSSFAVGTAAQATIGAAALAAAELWRLRSGRRQRVSVEMRDAAVEFRSERYLRVDGKDPDDHHDQIAGLYRCGDGRWARLHTNLPHHRQGLLQLLGCDHDKAAVQRALARWQAEALETCRRRSRACRHCLPDSFAEWDAHPQGRAVASLPLFSIEKIGDAPAQKLAPGQRPLSGIKVLDLTRIIAGPVMRPGACRHGADVLLVTAAHLPSMLPLVIDTGRGKLSAQIDLRQPDGREMLADLVREADVFVQGYRPGAVAAHGFAPGEVARLRPGIVYASLSAYGHEGPWALRRGFDSLVQTASGLNMAEAEAFGSSEPRPLPAQALDHATGYLLAFGDYGGAQAARRARRLLACSGLACANRSLAAPARPHRRHALPRSRL